MDDPQLGVTIEAVEGATVVAPRGDIDMSRAPAFRQYVRDALKTTTSRIVIDLSQVEYMDSSGLATLVEAMRNAKQTNTAMYLSGLHPKVLAIFEIARLHQFFRIVPTVSDAIQASR